MNSKCMIKMEKLKQDVSHYQLHSGKTYMQYEQDKYSIYQNYLYKNENLNIIDAIAYLCMVIF